MAPKVIIASGPVIVKDGRVLLDISGTDVFWKFCGGKVADGERLHHTAIRRAKEELGIDVTIIDQNPFLYFTLRRPATDEVEDVILVHFLATCGGEIVLGSGVFEARWHDVNALPGNMALNIVPALKHFGFLP